MILLALTTFCPTPLRAEGAVAAATGTIVSVQIERVNVFDPAVKGEDWWPFRIANKIHFLSKEAVVRRELLLGEGDRYDLLRALESERNLRSLGFFRRAEIRPVPRPDGGVDLAVRTQDSWTTTLQISVGTEGGENFIAYGASEENLFGYGKSLGYSYEQKGPRKRNEVRYLDPRFLGSRFLLAPAYARTHRGESISTELIQPFFSLGSPHAMGFGWNRTIDETILYQAASERSKFVQRDRTVFGSYGVRLPADRLFVQRVEAGWYSQKNAFERLPETTTLPVDREMSGPMLGYAWVQPRYIKETYLNRMERVEDFNLGNELNVLGGYMGDRLGSDRERWVFNVIDQQGLYLLPGRFALAQTGLTGRITHGKWENTILFANLNLFWKTTWLFPQTWVAHLEGNLGRRLDGENQVILGGDTGLRGYKNNAFTGARSVLVNLENRFFFPGEFFHLVRFGAAVFFDSGAVMPDGSGVSFSRFRSDAGAGLRAASTRSKSGGVVRADVAYALNAGPGGSRLVVSVKGRQAFEIFNSSSRRVRQSPGSRLFNAPSRNE